MQVSGSIPNLDHLIPEPSAPSSGGCVSSFSRCRFHLYDKSDAKMVICHPRVVPSRLGHTHAAHCSSHMTKTSKPFQHFLISTPYSFTMAMLSCRAPPPLPLLLLFLLPFPFAESVDLVVTTNGGQVRGTALTVLGGQVRAFLGIPYGKPPVGNLRFRVPQPADKWEGVRSATQFPNSCFQLRDTAYPGGTPAGSASRDNLSNIYLLGLHHVGQNERLILLISLSRHVM